ncbi:MAG TPA: roadblock/LC7 domain-containing protein, partial [Candidatus Dormibacteraeota bacterium]|nr:roadblock/LC7 domain-containing protein [Candidatus Dormibacteraeota bacterium]
APANGHSKGIEIGLDTIIQGLPLELQPRVRTTEVGGLSITVPLEKVLAQLSRGAVKVSFGELRQAAPDVFTAQNDRDRVLVALPLAEILAKLNPTLIARRRVQKQVEVPADISSPFDDHGERLAQSIAAAKAEAESVVSTPTPPRHSAPPAPAAAATPAAIPSRSSISTVSSPVPAELNAVPASAPSPRFNMQKPALAPAPKPSVPSASVVPHAAPAQAPAKPAPTPAKAGVPFNPNPTLVKPLSPIDPTPIAASQALPSPMPTPALKPVAHPSREPLAPAAIPVAPAAPAVAVETLSVGLASLAEAWPEEVRKEIISLGLAEAKVGLPVSSIEQALRQGRICFSWKSLRAWVKPAVPIVASAHDGTVLDLPLKLVAPLFLERQREAAKSKQKVSIDEDIPNLFFGFPQPEGTPSPAVATARSSDTNYYVWEDSHDTARIHESEVKRGPSPGTKFVAKYATPNEVVSRAAGLEGVVGALIALPDGLMVANRLPPDLNADTLAAFLPQIFGKVSQCTKELRMGELNNLNFTVGNVPWKIFRVNAIFFAAFGQAGMPLPTAQLAALAAELDHKPK